MRFRKQARFTLPGPFALLAELAEMIGHTEMRGLFYANHASNYLPIRVRMPHQRAETVRMLRELVQREDAFLLTPERSRRL